MAANLTDSGDDGGSSLEEDLPAYMKKVTDVKFLNISIKGYEKKSSSSGFAKEEYYAYKVVSMYVQYLR